MLKVGGRLGFGEYLPECTRYTAIFPKASRLSMLLASDVHVRFMHAGAQTCVSQLRRRFWICGIEPRAATDS